MNFHNESEDSFSSRPYYSARRLASTTSIRTPNQLYELQLRLNAGVKNVEISGPLQPESFEQIPEQHFEEMRRLAKITGAQVSLHAPMFDLSGFDQRGEWKEQNREATEYQFKSIIDRANKLSPDGNIPITVHTNGGLPTTIPDKSLGKYSERQAREMGIPYLAGRDIPRATMAIDQEEGRLLPVEFEKKSYITGDKTWTPFERINNANATKWQQESMRLLSMQKVYAERQADAEDKYWKNVALIEAHQRGIQLNEQDQQRLSRAVQDIQVDHAHMQEIDQDMRSALNEMYHKVTKYGNRNIRDEDQKNIQSLREAWENQSRINQLEVERLEAKQINDPYKIREIESKIERMKSPESEYNLNLNNAMLSLANIRAPEILIPVDDFVAKKAKETIVNTAMHAYKNYGEKAPVIAVENWHPDTPLSRGETFQKFITDTKKEFSQQLMKEKGLNENQAKEVANRLIGATWDVAHINLLRKFGYSQEDIVNEARQVRGADIKKIHLADNFGYSDAHLVTGMGNVPTFEQLAALEKTGLRKDIPMIGEFGMFDVEFKESSVPYALEALNSPLYSMNNASTWKNSREAYPDYFGGYGMVLPDMHFRDFYGAGFSNLPKELGGQMTGDRSRFSGTPNQ